MRISSIQQISRIAGVLAIGIAAVVIMPLFMPKAHAALINASGEFGQYSITTTANTSSLAYGQYAPNSSLGSVNAIGINEPRAAVLDTVNHRLFVSDYYNNRVLVFQLDTNNDLPSANTAAAYVLGQSNFTSSGATTTQSGLSNPYGLAYDPASQRLFVADNGNSRVMVFDVATSTIANGENAVNVIGQANFAAGSYSSGQNRLWLPEGLAYDPASQRLFVADTGMHRVMVFPVSTSTITNGENATDVIGQSNFSANNFATTQNGFENPSGLLYEPISQRLFVADHGNNRVMVFAAGTSTIATSSESAANVLGQANFTSNTPGTTQNSFQGPDGLAYDPASQRLFVADNGNSRVMVFDAATSTITNGENAVNVVGQTNFISNPSVATQSGLSGPEGLSYDTSTQKLFVGDIGNNRIMIFPVSTSTIAAGENAVGEIGQYEVQYSTNGTPQYTSSATNSGLTSANPLGVNQPYGVAIDSIYHRLFVSDANNNRVLVFPLDNNNAIATSSVSASYVLGQPNFTTNGFADTQSGLNYPMGLFYDPVTQRLFVADHGNNRVMVFDVATSTITNGENAVNVIGQANFTSGSYASAQNALYGPMDEVYDPVTQRLFVADHGNNRVMVFDAATSTITNGENAVNVLGQANFTSYNSATTQSGFYGPQALAYDTSTQRLFVSDVGNSRVMVFDVATSTIANGENAVNVIGQANFVSSNTATTQNGLLHQYGITYDPTAQRLFVADNGNNRVMVFNAGTSTITNGENATDVIGQTNFTVSNSAAPQSGFFRPQDIAYDPVGANLFVVDYTDNRVMAFPIPQVNVASLSPDATLTFTSPDAFNCPSATPVSCTLNATSSAQSVPVSFTPTLAVPGGSMTIDGAAWTSGQSYATSVPPSNGSITLTINVTGADNSTSSYSVYVTTAHPGVTGTVAYVTSTQPMAPALTTDGTNVWFGGTGPNGGDMISEVSASGTLISSSVSPSTTIQDVSGLAYTTSGILSVDQWGTFSKLSNGTWTISTPPTSTAYSNVSAFWDLALDKNGNAWTIPQSNNVVEISPTGTFLGNFTVNGSYNYLGAGLAYDGTNMWVALDSGDITEVSPTGSILNTLNLGSSAEPAAIAFDGTNMWTANYGNGTITEISPAGKVLHTYTPTDQYAGYDAIAFDGTNMWAAGQGDNQIVKITPTGTISVYTLPNLTYTAALVYATDTKMMWALGYQGGGVVGFPVDQSGGAGGSGGSGGATTYSVTVTQGAHGTISPGTQSGIASGASSTFTITPSSGYQIASVVVDGSSVGTSSSYTLSNITANHTLTATFSAVSSGGSGGSSGGGSTPSGPVVEVAAGGGGIGAHESGWPPSESSSNNAFSNEPSSGTSSTISSTTSSTISSNTTLNSSSTSEGNPSENNSGSNTSLQTQLAALLTQLASLETQAQSQGITTPTSATNSITNILSCTFANDLSLGANSTEVQCLQTALNDLGYTISTNGAGSPGYETKYFGKETKNAVKQFQQANHITPASGFFGPETRGALEKALHGNQNTNQGQGNSSKALGNNPGQGAGNTTSTPITTPTSTSASASPSATTSSSTSTSPSSTTSSTSFNTTNVSSNPTTLQNEVASLQAQIASLQAQIAPNTPPTTVTSPSSVATAGACSFTQDISMGATGAEVLCLQEGLNNLGFTVAASGPGSPGNETTYFGPETEQALKKFQVAYSITADGYFGTASRVEMKNLFQGESIATIAVLQREVVSLIAELKTLEAEAIARGLIH